MTTYAQFLNTPVPVELLHRANEGEIEAVSAHLINLYLDKVAEAIKANRKRGPQYIMENLAYANALLEIESIKIEVPA